jgi:hypothetical protein
MGLDAPAGSFGMAWGEMVWEIFWERVSRVWVVGGIIRAKGLEGNKRWAGVGGFWNFGREMGKFLFGVPNIFRMEYFECLADWKVAKSGMKNCNFWRNG